MDESPLPPESQEPLEHPSQPHASELVPPSSAAVPPEALSTEPQGKADEPGQSAELENTSPANDEPIVDAADAESCAETLDESQRRERHLVPVQYLKGVGPKRAELLEKLGLRTARDLVFNFPRSYERIEPATPLDDLVEGQAATVLAEIQFIEQRKTRRGLDQLIVQAKVDTRRIKAMWFNQKYLAKKVFQGMRALFSGVPKFDGNRWIFMNPKLIPLRDDEPIPSGRILPVYSLTQGLHQRHLRTATQSVLGDCVPLIAEVLPPRIREQAGLVGIEQALRAVHLPESDEQLEQGRRRLVFQELLVLQLALAMRRRKLHTECRAPALPVDSVIDARIVRLFPFELTEDQRRCIDEISRDMGQTV
ncbi:MAG: hypothetical protein R3B96_19785, partial [Pirellulaceae bacterium]